VVQKDYCDGQLLRLKRPNKNNMKIFSATIVIAVTISFFSFNEKHNTPYHNLYTTSLAAFLQQQASLENTIAASDLSSQKDMKAIHQSIEKNRLTLKNIDFWLRYLKNSNHPTKEKDLVLP
jgi:hypothetical protein